MNDEQNLVNIKDVSDEGSSLDEVFVMRYSKNGQPEIIEILNPVHKILITNVADLQPSKFISGTIRKYVIKVLLAAGTAIARGICNAILN